MKLSNWFGYEPIEGAVMAWGARAIFNVRSENPLDILPDRQGWSGLESNTAEELFSQDISERILPEMQKMARYFNPDSTDRFVRYYDCKFNPDWFIVAMGAPLASYGYFYVSVSLVDKDSPHIPMEIRPDLDIEVSRRKAAALMQEFEALQEQHRVEMRQRAKNVKLQTAIVHELFEAGRGPYKKPTQVLEPNDMVIVEANQARRDARVIKVLETEALVEYIMPSGVKFLRVIDAVTHEMIRNVSSKKLPKKWS